MHRITINRPSCHLFEEQNCCDCRDFCRCVIENPTSIIAGVFDSACAMLSKLNSSNWASVFSVQLRVFARTTIDSAMTFYVVKSDVVFFFSLSSCLVETRTRTLLSSVMWNHQSLPVACVSSRTVDTRELSACESKSTAAPGKVWLTI